MDKRSLKRYTKLLHQKRAEFEESYRDKLSRSGDDSGHEARDPADEASMNYTKEFWYSLSDNDRLILQRVDMALQRVEEGTFGLCIHCEKKIQKKRLDAVPWARHCLECQDLQDRGLL